MPFISRRRIHIFSFKDHTHEEVANLLNKEIPISLKYNEELIERIYSQYPLISKAQVAIIVTTIFQTWRDIIVQGGILHFTNLFFSCKLLFYPRRIGGVILPAVKIRTDTTKKVKKIKAGK